MVILGLQREMSHIMRNPAFCICENKGSDRLNPEADQSLCFRYKERSIPILPKYEISSEPSYHLLCLYSPVCVGHGPKTGFVTSGLKLFIGKFYHDSIILPLHWPTSKLIFNLWHMSQIWALSRENLFSGFPTRSDTNRVEPLQKLARSLKCRI